jgi:hypothetical protein
MNRWGLGLLVACAAVAGCGDDDSPTSPSGAPVVLSAVLSPANEVPPVSNAESGGTGAVQVTLNPTAGTATFYFQLTGFPPGTTVTGAHIHPGSPGVNGGVIVPTSVTNANAVRLTDGTGEFRSPTIPVEPAVMQALINNPGAFYFNVHSPLNAPGFARGQLARVQ